MNGEWTVGDLFEEIAERVASARTRALMGERHEALMLLQRARIDYLRFRDVLRAYPGGLALEQSMQTAQESLCAERESDRERQHADAGRGCQDAESPAASLVANAAPARLTRAAGQRRTAK
jgi:hypothetical protein